MDATEGFEDVGHSEDARDQLKDLQIGELPEEDRKIAEAKASVSWKKKQHARGAAAGHLTLSFTPFVQLGLCVCLSLSCVCVWCVGFSLLPFLPVVFHANSLTHSHARTRFFFCLFVCFFAPYQNVAPQAPARTSQGDNAWCVLQ